MLNHRPPPASPPTPRAELPEPVEGFIHWARQTSLIFGRDRHAPVDSRPVMRVARRNHDWVVLPSTTQRQGANANFFYIPADSPDCVFTQPDQARDAWYYRFYECLDPADCHARPHAMLSQPLRLAVTEWLRHAWTGREARP